MDVKKNLKTVFGFVADALGVNQIANHFDRVMTERYGALRAMVEQSDRMTNIDKNASYARLEKELSRPLPLDR